MKINKIIIITLTILVVLFSCKSENQSSGIYELALKGEFDFILDICSSNEIDKMNEVLYELSEVCGVFDYYFRLKKQGVDVENNKEKYSKFCNTFLTDPHYYKARSINTDMVLMLLENGADIHYILPDKKRTILDIFVSSCEPDSYYEIILYLKQKNLLPVNQSETLELIKTASKNGSFKIARLLLYPDFKISRSEYEAITKNVDILIDDFYLVWKIDDEDIYSFKDTLGKYVLQ